MGIDGAGAGVGFFGSGGGEGRGRGRGRESNMLGDGYGGGMVMEKGRREKMESGMKRVDSPFPLCHSHEKKTYLNLILMKNKISIPAPHKTSSSPSPFGFLLPCPHLTSHPFTSIPRPCPHLHLIPIPLYPCEFSSSLPPPFLSFPESAWVVFP